MQVITVEILFSDKVKCETDEFDREKKRKKRNNLFSENADVNAAAKTGFKTARSHQRQPTPTQYGPAAHTHIHTHARTHTNMTIFLP